MSWYQQWSPYVPVAQRKANAARYAAALAKKEKRSLSPVKLEGRKFAKTFWGTAWCENLERYSDYSNRLPRGGTYVRNGSVIDLQIGKGTINALVSGSDVYTIKIKIETLTSPIWKTIQKDCSQSIDSLLDLLQGKFDRGVMERLTQKEGGLFPRPKEIRLSCSCPDSAGMCKHIAATMYGVGHRLDSSPELLFQLRGVDHLELVGAAVSATNLGRSLDAGQENALTGSDLGELFGIELEVISTEKVNEIATSSKKARSVNKSTKTRKIAPSSTARLAADAIPQHASTGKTAKRPTSTAAKTANRASAGTRRQPIKVKSAAIKKKRLVIVKSPLATRTEPQPDIKTAAARTTRISKKAAKKTLKATIQVTAKQTVRPKRKAS